MIVVALDEEQIRVLATYHLREGMVAQGKGNFDRAKYHTETLARLPIKLIHPLDIKLEEEMAFEDPDLD